MNYNKKFKKKMHYANGVYEYKTRTERISSNNIIGRRFYRFKIT